MSDFTRIVEIGGVFVATELDSGVDFSDTGDQGQIVIDETGYGDGGWGDVGWGEGTTIVVNAPTTVWTNINTP